MRAIIQFLQEVRQEFKNISWPKKDALIQLTFVVISISIIISLLLGGFDYIFTQSLNFVGQPAAPQPQVQISPAPINVASPSAATPAITISPKTTK